MTQPSSLDFLTARLRQSPLRRRVAIADPADDHTLEVVERALTEGVADFTLVASRQRADRAQAIARAHSGRVHIQMADSPEDAAALAVALVRGGQADVLMKGTLNTDVLLRAVLDKTCGLLTPGAVLTHVAVAHIPSYHKPLAFTDAAVIPYPTLEQMDAMLRAALSVSRRLGEAVPRAALIHCTEKTSPKFPQTLAYAELCRRAKDGLYGDALVDGPMDAKTACDAESARIKGISSPVAGEADILLFPDIEAGNTFYKTVTLFAGADTAGLLCGTEAPVVVASRADTARSKYHSLALACLMADGTATHSHDHTL